MIAYIQRYFSTKYHRWLDRRLPTSTSVTLSQKSIFIFPSGMGAFYLSLLVLILVTAVNYQNNLLFALFCLMVSLFVTAIAFTYQNLSGLRISAANCDAVYKGDLAQINIEFESKKNSKQVVNIGFDRHSILPLDEISAKKKASLTLKSTQRGWIKAPRILVYSHYPLGLLRCWSWVKLDFDLLVYPKPIHIPYRHSLKQPSDDLVSDVSEQIKGQTADDFYGFKRYQLGDSIKHIAWRQYAKTSQLLTKEFSSDISVERWLDWDVLSDKDIESKLSILCGWVLDAHEMGFEYGLNLQGEIIAVGSGFQQKKKCLTALALFGLPAKADGKKVR